ncbi:MAG: phosphotransferase [Microbacteriaceae bacterium]|nr:phosphotransferase [Microbacteriaceae bacterium]
MAAGLALFDDTSRGDRAPEWVERAVVERWDLPRGTEARLVVLSENVTFRAGDLAVRLARPGYGGGAGHARSELLWIEALRAAGFPTPAPVRGADGELVQTISSRDPDAPRSAAPDPRDMWLATATAWIEGEVLEDRADFARHAAEIGRLTARLHEHASGWRRPADFVRFEWDLPEMVGERARWGDWRAAALGDRERELLEEAERRAKRSLAERGVDAADRTTDRWGLIHADLRPSNAILRPDGSLAVIDFDDTGWGWWLADFAAALTFYEHRDVVYELAAGWIEGYTETARPLQWADLDEACAWSLIRRLTMLGWQQTHRADALPPDLWAEYQPGTLEVAARYLDDPRALVR